MLVLNTTAEADLGLFKGRCPLVKAEPSRGALELEKGYIFGLLVL